MLDPSAKNFKAIAVALLILGAAWIGVSTELREVFCFAYRATDPGSGLSEHEVDHVFAGPLDDEPRPDPEEIDDLRWIEQVELAGAATHVEKDDRFRLFKRPDTYKPGPNGARNYGFFGFFRLRLFIKSRFLFRTVTTNNW